jgi:hypothetical protein
MVMGSEGPGTKDDCPDEASISLPDQTTLGVRQKKKEISCIIPRVVKQIKMTVSLMGPRDNSDCADRGQQLFTGQS